MLKKPERIYRKPLPTEEFKPKPFNYSEEQPLSFIKILWYGLTGEELTPKNFKKYENFMSEAKIYVLTAIIGFSLFYVAFHSSLIKQTGITGDIVYEPTYLDYVIDFCIEKYYKLKSLINF